MLRELPSLNDGLFACLFTRSSKTISAVFICSPFLHCANSSREREKRQINYSSNRLMTPYRVLFIKVNLPHFHNYLHSIFHSAVNIYREVLAESRPVACFFPSIFCPRATNRLEKLKTKSSLT